MNTRQQDILNQLEQHGEITVKSLAEQFSVSAMTIHRDLDFLEEQHCIYKKRGAAVFVEQPDRLRGSFYADEKGRIGQKAAEFVRPGQSILFDNSTTALEVAKHLAGIPSLTFYTTNLEIAAIVASYPNTVLYCSGGYYFPDSKGFTGPQAEDFVSRIQADLCIIGASGISITHGITNPYPMHTALQRKIIEASAQRILVADHSKFGKVAMEKAADLTELHHIITDSGLVEETAAQYRHYVPLTLV